MINQYYKTIDCDGDPLYYFIGEDVRKEYGERLAKMIDDLSHQCNRWGEPLHSFADVIDENEVWSECDDDDEISTIVEDHETEMLKHE